MVYCAQSHFFLLTDNFTWHASSAELKLDCSEMQVHFNHNNCGVSAGHFANAWSTRDAQRSDPPLGGALASLQGCPVRCRAQRPSENCSSPKVPSCFKKFPLPSPNPQCMYTLQFCINDVRILSPSGSCCCRLVILCHHFLWKLLIIGVVNYPYYYQHWVAPSYIFFIWQVGLLGASPILPAKPFGLNSHIISGSSIYLSVDVSGRTWCACFGSWSLLHVDLLEPNKAPSDGGHEELICDHNLWSKLWKATLRRIHAHTYIWLFRNKLMADFLASAKAGSFQCKSIQLFLDSGPDSNSISISRVNRRFLPSEFLSAGLPQEERQLLVCWIQNTTPFPVKSQIERPAWTESGKKCTNRLSSVAGYLGQSTRIQETGCEVLSGA